MENKNNIPEERTAEQYYKKYEGYRKSDQHNDCPMTWDSVITHTEDFAKEKLESLSQQADKFMLAAYEYQEENKKLKGTINKILDAIKQLEPPQHGKD